MSKFSDAVSSVNSLLLTSMTLVVFGAVGVAGWLAYDRFFAPEIRAKQEAERELREARNELERVSGELTSAQSTVNQQAATIDSQSQTITDQQMTIDDQVVQIDELTELNERLETAMRLLKVNHRLAHIKVLEVGVDDEGIPFSRVEFVEMTPEGQELGKPKEFYLRGDEIRVDCWIVKFEDKYIQDSDLHRSTSLCVFKSIYGNDDGPRNAHLLEEQYSRPVAYARGSQVTEFEQGIWDDFWDIANDPMRALELGIRANHGQVNYVKAQAGLIYQVDLRASDGLTIRPIDIDESLINNDGEDSGDGEGASNDVGG